MANVYLAQHDLLKRPTAVKLLKPARATDEMIARFEREVQLAASSRIRTRSRSSTTAARATGCSTTRWSTSTA